MVNPNMPNGLFHAYLLDESISTFRGSGVLLHFHSISDKKSCKQMPLIWVCPVFQKRDARHKMSQLMRLWYLSHRRPAKAQASLRIHAVSPEPSLFAHMKYGSRQKVRPKNRHLAPLDGCACAFEKLVYEGRKVP